MGRVETEEKSIWWEKKRSFTNWEKGKGKNSWRKSISEQGDPKREKKESRSVCGFIHCKAEGKNCKAANKETGDS